LIDIYVTVVYNHIYRYIDTCGTAVPYDGKGAGMEIEKCYNLNEVADILSVKVRTIRKWVNEGIINGRKIAGTNRWIVTETELARLQKGE
jgi:hypothetical protein